MTLDIIPTEEQEQLALVQWLELHKIRYTHVPNEGKHKVQYRAKQKRLGVKPGIPDILIFDPPPACPENVGTAIELKRRKGGRVTPEQSAWLCVLKDRGWAVAVCQGAMEAIEFLESLGYGRGADETLSTTGVQDRNQDRLKAGAAGESSLLGREGDRHAGR